MKKFRDIAIVGPSIVSAIVGLLSYLWICSALRPRGWAAGPLSDAERYFAIGLSIGIAAIVFYRMCVRSWGRKQIEQLLDVDDAGY